MNCTHCNNGTLRPSFIDGLFRAHTCSGCGGNWILIEDFVTWKEKNEAYHFPADYRLSEEVGEDTKRALICPVSGVIMRKFKISAKNDHRIDYSVPVGGIWLDKGEWELLKAEGLAGALNQVVTAQWQKKIREENAADNFSALYEAKFGQADYAKIRDIREWLNAHPQKADLRSYLLAEDPYSAEK
ncbi:hypothetical protein VA7868_00501 [Vibrio aerogenes CECT 7868]|uniref:Transcription factor zinc-finger domain-containing protein n=1 Tax=Vibrio aerogenes CECT 7868 TaxID=1216006 RepID=A0A1M5VTT3_9VIBR|nr:zf-TFIIB domain-containing protein [Vibrio aerogenes]SHH78598.1 hypothetical protein VA7868_00501 [Vibrio aerogenes CECT 7868]